MIKREELTAAFERAVPEAANEKTAVVFEYSLAANEPDKAEYGIVAVTDKKLRRYRIGGKDDESVKIDESGKAESDKNGVTDSVSEKIAGGTLVLELDMADISEFRYRADVGCASVECVLKEDANGGESICGSICGSVREKRICRGDMRFCELYASVTKQLNLLLSDGVYSYGYEENMQTNCPKCGRRLASGQNVCAHCVGKSKYMRRLWKVAKSSRAYIYATVALFFAIAGVNLLIPYLNRILVDGYIQSENPVIWQQFVIVIAAIFGVNVLNSALKIARSLATIEAGKRVTVTLRDMVFGRIQMLSLSRISKRTSGQLMHRVTADTERLKGFITERIPGLIEQTLILAGVGGVLFGYDWKLALLILLPAPLVVVLNKLFWRKMHGMFRRERTLGERSSSVLYDIFSGIRVVKAFGMEHSETERYDKMIRDECETQIRNEGFFAIFMPGIEFLVGAGEFFLLYYVGSKILSHEMTIGEMAQFSSYVMLIYEPLRWISSLPRELTRFMTSVVKVFDVIDEKIDITEAENAVCRRINGEIEFDNASFGYDSGTDVLKNVSFKIKPGEMVGIVGRSGVGKSTLINLVMRMYDVDSGCVKIDGTDIRQYSQDSLRSQIGVVLQETFLFSGTVYDNIAYAKNGATRDEVITAAKLAGAHEFIMKLPDAYNTKVGERGHTLSGGERQRVAIARALLHDPRILILDEATASLDTETEKQIQDSIQKLTHDRTTLAIAHRLSTLRNATRLIVLDKGRLAEIGTHEELMEKKGIYYGLIMAQRQMSRMAPKKDADTDASDSDSDADADLIEEATDTDADTDVIDTADTDTDE